MAIEDLSRIAVGVERPEDVVIARDGVIWASDKASACARIETDGSFTRVGQAGGEPNGLAIDPRDGGIVIANILTGGLQKLTPATGAVTTLLTSVAGEPLSTPNYLVFDSRGNMWGTVSTRRGRVPEWLDGTPDGFIFRVDPAGRTSIVADGLRFPNGLALANDESALYLAQTAAQNILRFPILDDGLGPGEIYGPASLGAAVFPDGIAFDSAGDLWVCLVRAHRIERLRPDGSRIVEYDDPQARLLNHPTNISFGGPDMRDIHIGSIVADYVLRGRVAVPGAKKIHQL
jgi:gluconolactonase